MEHYTYILDNFNKLSLDTQSELLEYIYYNTEDIIQFDKFQLDLTKLPNDIIEVIVHRIKFERLFINSKIRSKLFNN